MPLTDISWWDMMRYKSKIKPWNHQKWALKRAWKLGNALLWADVGTGKTKIGVDYALARHQRGQVNRVLVVCPLAAVGVWERAFDDHDPGNIRVISRNDVDKIADLVPLVHEVRKWSNAGKGLGVVIVTYDALSRYVTLFADSFVPDLLIVDESHYIKSYSAVRTRRTLAVARVAKYRLLLTGTPAPNGYIDLYWQVKAVHPMILPPTIKGFRDRYCTMGGYMGKEIIGYKNTRELAKRLSRVVIRVPKSVLDLPPTIDQVVPVRLDQNTRSVYDRLTRDLVAQLESGETITAPNQIVLLLRLMQLTGREEKLSVLQEIVLTEQGKLVIFAQFLEEIEKICSMLLSLDISHGVIAGGKSGRERDEVIYKFQNSPDPRVIVAQVKAGGIAVTLTAASVAIFYSLSYDAEAYEQARGRIHRGGQTETCRYIHLLAQDTIDETVYDALRKKLKTQAILGEIVRGLTK